MTHLKTNMNHFFNFNFYDIEFLMAFIKSALWSSFLNASHLIFVDYLYDPLGFCFTFARAFHYLWVFFCQRQIS